MRCPVFKDSQLKMAERQGIQIDYGPDCRGVWLDRGELDKIIERFAPAVPAAAEPVRGESRRKGFRDDDARHKDKRFRKRGLPGDLFDFD